MRILKNYLEAFKLANDSFLFVGVNKGDNASIKRLSTTSINSIVKHYFPDLSAHSLRVGFVTTAHKIGKSNAQIGLQSGQTNQTIDRYIRLEKNVDNNAIVGMF